MTPERPTERLIEATERVKDYLRMAKEADGGNPMNRDQLIEVAKMIQSQEQHEGKEKNE